MRAAKKRKQRQRQMEAQKAGEPAPADLLDTEVEQSRGLDLWDFLRPRLKLLVEQQKKWGDIRDIYDSHTASYHEEVSLPPWIRDPNDGTFSLVWDLVQLIFLAYVSSTVPLRVCFDIDVALWSFWFWVDNIVDAYFIIDLFMNFRTSFKREDGLMEDDWSFITMVRSHAVFHLFLINLSQGTFLRDGL